MSKTNVIGYVLMAGIFCLGFPCEWKVNLRITQLIGSVIITASITAYVLL
jgi:hypothetical protein